MIVEKKGRACALTGHRSLPSPFPVDKLKRLLEERILAGSDYFLCGMATGFDLLALEQLLLLKEKYPIRIEACVPFVGQERKFSEREKARYAQFLGECDKKTVFFQGFNRGSYLIRDRYMVSCADEVVAYCTRSSGGTAYTVNEARKKGIPVYYVNQEDRTK